MKNKPLFILFFVFIVMNILDLIISKFLLFGESNPLYLLSKNFFSLLLIKTIIIITIFIIIYKNKYPSIYYNYIVINYILYSILILFLAVIFNSINLYNFNNLTELQQNEIKEINSNLSNTFFIKEYIIFVSIFYVVPFFMSLISFFIYNKNLKYIKINKKYNKFNLWWKNE